MSDFETRLKDVSHTAWVIWTANACRPSLSCAWQGAALVRMRRAHPVAAVVEEAAGQNGGRAPRVR